METVTGVVARGLRNVLVLSLLGLAAACATPVQKASPLSLQQTQIYEMRTYDAEPGKFDRLNARFRDHTLKLFARHGMTSVGYWAEEEVANGRLVYILAYPGREAREASWAAFRADPEWQAAAKASEVDGKLVAKVTSVFMRMTDYSPPLQVAP
jgi:hypothetical protein